MSTWQELLDKNADQHLQEYLDFLRIPSISSLSENMPPMCSTPPSGWRSA